MKIVFKMDLSQVRAAIAILVFCHELNRLSFKYNIKGVVWCKKGKFGFLDGGKLDIVHQRSAKSFKEFSLKGLEDPMQISSLIVNAARHGILSHGLYNKIQVLPGQKGQSLIIGINE